MAVKIKYRAGYKYLLAETVQIQTNIKQAIDTDYITLTEEGLLTVKQHYAWDGPSGPTIDTKTFMRGPLAHDAVYQLIREGKLTITDARLKADKMLRKLILQDGMNPIRAWWVYHGVRIGGARSAKKGRPILEAP